MVDPLLASYEAVPYESHCIPFTDIGRMEAIARLFGVTPPLAMTARVLELGCASGGNLTPLAHRFPDATFVGIDLTPGQIAVGQRVIAGLGLTNITLQTLSITDIPDDFGTFDYIICHGVYSWVPPHVQDAILRVCKKHLAPNGIAYVSYNTYPGWHLRGMVREMVLYHDDRSLTPTARITRAHAFIDLLTQHGSEPPGLLTLQMKEELEIIRGQGDAHFLHEQLEAYNAPVYFAEFASRASERGLRFLAEAKLGDRTSVAAPWAEEAAGPDADPIRVQQYVDYAVGRMFRRSLLCHDNQSVRSRPNPAVVTSLRIALRGEPETVDESAPPTNPGVETFTSPEGALLASSSPLLLAALHALLRVAPASLPFPDLLRRATDRMSIDAPPGLPLEADRDIALAEALLMCAFGGVVEFTNHPSTFTTNVSALPVASRVARALVDEGKLIPSLRHGSIRLSPMERIILARLDGTHDREQLLAVLVAAVESGELSLEDDPAALPAHVEATLARLARGALLEA